MVGHPEAQALYGGSPGDRAAAVKASVPQQKADTGQKQSHPAGIVGEPESRDPKTDVRGGGMPPLSCLECGATAKTFADAQMWSQHREKRRLYMKERRKK